jgi:hypothetical protein
MLEMKIDAGRVLNSTRRRSNPINSMFSVPISDISISMLIRPGLDMIIGVSKKAFCDGVRLCALAGTRCPAVVSLSRDDC